jgi:tRNA threonylcarbamoyl adenosine modification protein YeaZ
MLLAIDTSTEMASLAIVEDGWLINETTWHCGQNHTRQLLPRLYDILKKAGRDIQSVTGLAVARGPGSFNGLRVGISTAKGLAFSLNIPLVGISTLEAAAYQHVEAGLPVCVIQNAGRNEIATATFQMRSSTWLRLAPERITTLDLLLAEIDTKTLFCGEYVPSITGKLETLGARAYIPPPASLPRRASFLAELGQKRLNAGESDDPAALQPLYLRRPPITERKHQ